MSFWKKKYKIFYVLENDHLSYSDAKSVDNINTVHSLVDQISGDYYIGVYCNKNQAQVLIRWNEENKCYNVETSFGDDGLFKNVSKQELDVLLNEFDDVVNDSQKYGFTEDQSPW